MSMHRAYRHWQATVAERDSADEHSVSFAHLHARVDKALQAIAGEPMLTAADVAMAFEAVLSQVDLPEPARQVTLDGILVLQSLGLPSK